MKALLIALFCVLSFVVSADPVTMHYGYLDMGGGYTQKQYDFYEASSIVCSYSQTYADGVLLGPGGTFYNSGGASIGDGVFSWPVAPGDVPGSIMAFSDADMWANFLDVEPSATGGLLGVHFPPPPGGYVVDQIYSDVVVPEPVTGFFLMTASLLLCGRRCYRGVSKG